jgi:hypothetical protein
MMREAFRVARCLITSMLVNAGIWFPASIDLSDYLDPTDTDPGEAITRALGQLTLTTPVPQLAGVFAVSVTALLGMAKLARRCGGTWTLILVAVVWLNALAAAVRVLSYAVAQLPMAASVLSVAAVIASVLTAGLLLWWPGGVPAMSGPADPEVAAARPSAVTRACWLLLAGAVLSWFFSVDPGVMRGAYGAVVQTLSEPHLTWLSGAELVVAIVVPVAVLALGALILARLRPGRWWVRTLLALCGLFLIVDLTKAAFHVVAPHPGAPNPGFGFVAGVLGRALILIAVVSLFWPTTTNYFDSRTTDPAG